MAARRWKTQINENAKTPAFFAVQPELSHNEVAGWGQHGDVTRQVLSLITLRHAGENPQVARRFDLVVDATDEVMANVIPVWARATTTSVASSTSPCSAISSRCTWRAAKGPIRPGAPLTNVESALRR